MKNLTHLLITCLILVSNSLLAQDFTNLHVGEELRVGKRITVDGISSNYNNRFFLNAHSNHFHIGRSEGNVSNSFLNLWTYSADKNQDILRAVFGTHFIGFLNSRGDYNFTVTDDEAWTIGKFTTNGSFELKNNQSSGFDNGFFNLKAINNYLYIDAKPKNPTSTGIRFKTAKNSTVTKDRLIIDSNGFTFKDHKGDAVFTIPEVDFEATLNKNLITRGLISEGLELVRDAISVPDPSGNGGTINLDRKFLSFSPGHHDIPGHHAAIAYGGDENYNDAGLIFAKPSNSSPNISEQTSTLFLSKDREVGVGTITPTKKLDVNGDARIRTLPVGTATDEVVTTDANGNLRKVPASTIGGGANLVEDNNFIDITDDDGGLVLSHTHVDPTTAANFSNESQIANTEEATATTLNSTIKLVNGSISLMAGEKGSSILMRSTGDMHFDLGPGFVERPGYGFYFNNATDDRFVYFEGSEQSVGVGHFGKSHDIIGLNLNSTLDVRDELRTGTHPTRVPGMYVTGDFDPAKGIEFRHTNATQGIGFGYNTIYATGNHANQDLNLKARGTGKLGLKSASIMWDKGNDHSIELGTPWTETGIIFNRNDNGNRTRFNMANYKNSTEANRYFGMGFQGEKTLNIRKGGNVGIGTSNPNKKLTVHGDVLLKNRFTFIDLDYENTNDIVLEADYFDNSKGTQVRIKDDGDIYFQYGEELQHGYGFWFGARGNDYNDYFALMDPKDEKFTVRAKLIVDGDAHITGKFLDSSGAIGSQGQTLKADSDGKLVWSSSTAGPGQSHTNLVVRNSLSVTSNSEILPQLEAFDASKSSLHNAKQRYGAISQLFNGNVESGINSTHIKPLDNNLDWGMGYTFSNLYFFSELKIQNRKDCCFKRAGGGVFKIYKGGVLVYTSPVIQTSNTGSAYSDAVYPNIEGDEVRYIFENGAKTQNNDRVFNASEIVMIGSSVQGDNTINSFLVSNDEIDMQVDKVIINHGRTDSNPTSLSINAEWVVPDAVLNVAGLVYIAKKEQRTQTQAEINAILDDDYKDAFGVFSERPIIAPDYAFSKPEDWADYVFDENYKLIALEEEEEFIKNHGHLPGFPSAKEVQEKGHYSNNELNMNLLRKVEELTLHVIELNKQIKELKKSSHNLKSN